MPSELDQNLDSLLPKIGGFGRYQRYIFTLMSITAALNGFVYLNFVFTSRVIGHRCSVPECESSPTKFKEKWVDNAILDRSTKTFFKPVKWKCQHYKLIGTDCNNASHWDENEVEKCEKKDLVYEEEKMWTIMQEFDLVCDRTEYCQYIGTLQNLGQFVGLGFYGYVADRIGRRNILVIGSFLSGLCGFAKFIYINYYTFALFEFLNCLANRGSFICSYVLATEIVPPEWRAFTGNFMGVAGAFGQIALAWVDYIVGNWKWTILITHGAQFFAISYYWLASESIRWQLVKGKTEQAKKTLRKLAKVNGKEVLESDLDVFNQPKSESTGGLAKGILKKALKSRILMTRLCLVTYCWMAKNFLYYGITFNSVYLKGFNKHLSFTLAASVDVPAYFLTGYIAQRFGRKTITVLCFAITAVAFMVILIVKAINKGKSGMEWIDMLLWLVGKFSSGMMGGILYIWTIELFPTYLRQTFMGAISSLSRVGTMGSTLQQKMEDTWAPLPWIMYASVSGIGAFVGLFAFPETKNKQLPDNVEEAENIKNAPLIEVETKALK